jgi:glycosyltransferase involved in cell wall biosynthesis
VIDTRPSSRLTFVSEEDDGQSVALNRAISRSRGEWIGWLNADEFYLPGSLGMLADAGDSAGVDVVYGDTVFVDGTGRLTRLLPQHPFDSVTLRSYGCFIATVSCLIRAAVLRAEEPPIDPGLRRMMDWDLFMRLDRVGARYLHVTSPVGAFRAHDSRVTATERRGFFDALNTSDGFGREYELMRERYCALRWRRLGHVRHGVLKLRHGAYRRQIRAQRLRGTDMRWFATGEGAAGVGRLMAECYGR